MARQSQLREDWRYGKMTSALGLCLGSLAAAYVFLSALLHLTHDAKEPPAFETSIPFISPLLGLIPGKQNFFVKQRSVASHL